MLFKHCLQNHDFQVRSAKTCEAGVHQQLAFACRDPAGTKNLPATRRGCRTRRCGVAAHGVASLPHLRSPLLTYVRRARWSSCWWPTRWTRRSTLRSTTTRWTRLRASWPPAPSRPTTRALPSTTRGGKSTSRCAQHTNTAASGCTRRQAQRTTRERQGCTGERERRGRECWQRTVWRALIELRAARVLRAWRRRATCGWRARTTPAPCSSSCKCATTRRWSVPSPSWKRCAPHFLVPTPRTHAGVAGAGLPHGKAPPDRMSRPRSRSGSCASAAPRRRCLLLLQTKSHSLGVLVLDYVNEEKDGASKDEYRFKLNIAMGQYQEAARDAMELARFEQVRLLLCLALAGWARVASGAAEQVQVCGVMVLANSMPGGHEDCPLPHHAACPPRPQCAPQEEGNYRVAHDKLFATVRHLEELRNRVPTELMRSLMLLHSYTLVKSLIAITDHTTAARMLVRVARCGRDPAPACVHACVSGHAARTAPPVSASDGALMTANNLAAAGPSPSSPSTWCPSSRPPSSSATAPACARRRSSTPPCSCAQSTGAHAGGIVPAGGAARRPTLGAAALLLAAPAAHRVAQRASSNGARGGGAAARRRAQGPSSSQVQEED